MLTMALQQKMLHREDKPAGTDRLLHVKLSETATNTTKAVQESAGCPLATANAVLSCHIQLPLVVCGALLGIACNDL